MIERNSSSMSFLDKNCIGWLLFFCFRISKRKMYKREIFLESFIAGNNEGFFLFQSFLYVTIIVYMSCMKNTSVQFEEVVLDIFKQKM